MRRKRVFTRGRAVSVLVAAGIGYAIGGWSAAAVRSGVDLTAAQTIALRFPQDLEDAVPVATTALAAASSGTMMANAQLALLSPEPMVPQALVSAAPAASEPVAVSASMRVASAVVGTIRSVLPEKALQRQAAAPAAQPAPDAKAAAQQTPEAKAVAAAAAAKRHAERQGFVLNDVQIASIKQRLHLTEDQQQMWPAVEAALRNIAYARAREAKRQGTNAGATHVASSIDPNSVEVQGLKDAAVPLIMSFSSEQRDEVRSIAHVMGLDQLASQF